MSDRGISLYLQGTLNTAGVPVNLKRYIPVPTGNSTSRSKCVLVMAVYPCTYRELLIVHSLPYLLNRYIPVPTGNSWTSSIDM